MSGTKQMALVCGLAALSAMISTAAFADRIGNGGNVLKTPTGLRVLDLVEAGAADGPGMVFDNPDPRLQAAIKWAFWDNSVEVTAEDQKTLVSYLSIMPSGQTFALAAGLKAYTWHWVDEPLNDVPDVDSSVHYKPEDIIQTAVRSGFSILIRRDIWNQLDSRNRAALLLHEVIYAYELPQEMRDAATSKKYFAQSSPLARQVVGDLFSSSHVDLVRYSTDGKPRFGAIFPDDGRGSTIIASDVFMDQQTKAPGFKFSPTAKVRFQEEIDRNKPGWWFSPSKDTDWVQGNFSDALSGELAEECDAESRSYMESLGKDGKLSFNNEPPLPAKAGYSVIHIDGSLSDFSVRFGEYQGLHGPMIYLKPVIQTAYFTGAKIAAEATQAECEEQLKAGLVNIAKHLFQ